MDELDKKRLQVNLPLLVKDLRVEDVKDYLYAEGVLTDEDMETLSLPVLTPQEAVRKLIISILPKRGAKGFSVFMKTLKNSTQAYLAEAIENTEVSLDGTDSALNSPINEILTADHLKQLQNQLWIQTELMVQYKREMDDLRGKLEMSEKERNEMNERFSQLQLTMDKNANGMTEDRVVEYLNYYMETNVSAHLLKQSGDRRPSRSRRPFLRLKSAASGDGYDDSDAIICDAELGSDNDMARIGRPPRPVMQAAGGPEFTPTAQSMDLRKSYVIESVAKAVGRDILHYMIRGDTTGLPVKEPQATMRFVVQKIQQEHADFFKSAVSTLGFNEVNGFATLLRLADIVLEDGEIHWGRIVSLYAFSGSVGALLFKQRSADGQDTQEMEELIADFLGFYMSRRVGNWIEENGGWETFVKIYGQKSVETEEPHSVSAWKQLLEFTWNTIVTINKT